MLWLFKTEDMTEVLERCTKLSVRTVKKSVKSPLNPEKIVRFTAEIVFQSIKIAAVRSAMIFHRLTARIWITRVFIDSVSTERSIQERYATLSAQ